MSAWVTLRGSCHFQRVGSGHPSWVGSLFAGQRGSAFTNQATFRGSGRVTLHGSGHPSRVGSLIAGRIGSQGGRTRPVRSENLLPSLGTTQAAGFGTPDRTGLGLRKFENLVTRPRGLALMASKKACLFSLIANCPSRGLGRVTG